MPTVLCVSAEFYMSDIFKLEWEWERNSFTDIAQWTLPSLISVTLLALTFLFVKRDYSKKIFKIQQNFFGRKVRNSLCTFYALQGYKYFVV